MGNIVSEKTFAFPIYLAYKPRLTGYPIQLLKMRYRITKSTTIDPTKFLCDCNNFVKAKDTFAFLKVVTLLVCPMGLELGIGAEGRWGTGPRYKKMQKQK